MPLNHAPIPVTVFCGFLGAGKTTLLTHLLNQAEGRRWAAIVNDVATLNLDVVTVRAANTAELTEIIGLSAGCVCCSRGAELGETLATLARTGQPGGGPGTPFSHIFIETTGVAEPRSLAALFTQTSPFARPLNDFVQLSALVTVVDGRFFLEQWRHTRATPPPQPSPSTTTAGSTRPLFELLVEQVECADILVLNQCDRLSPDDQTLVSSLLSGLNPRAELISTEQGQVPAELWLTRQRFDPSLTLGAARWIKTLNQLTPLPPNRRSLALNPARHEHHAAFGITAVTYQARAPFHTELLTQAFAQAWPGLLRAKGFFWTRTQPDEMQFLSLAGGQLHLSTLNPWWASMLATGRASWSDCPERVRTLWQEPYGDRRQELVLIGTELNAQHVQTTLDECLTT